MIYPNDFNIPIIYIDDIIMQYIRAINSHKIRFNLIQSKLRYNLKKVKYSLINSEFDNKDKIL